MATAGQSQSSHPSGQEVLSDVARAAASTSATVGFMLEIASFVAAHDTWPQPRHEPAIHLTRR
jgi:hypothetical protein